ncbi:MAG: NAD(P)H-dependent oxidoreductase [Candidatus Lokiarchaeota archaeon]|nr:NAD(P)H-dependent oxidoreductase [Candidatus Lokiarchaeota archaeon]
MKKLILYYSRTGRTKHIAEIISKKLSCDIEEIIDLKGRSGIIGFLRGGNAARKGELTELNKFMKNPKDYELIIIGTPIWGGKMPPAIKTFLMEFKDKLDKVAFFCTQGGWNGGSTLFQIMQEVSGKTPIATLEIGRKELKEKSYDDKITDYISQLEK